MPPRQAALTVHGVWKRTAVALGASFAWWVVLVIVVALAADRLRGGDATFFVALWTLAWVAPGVGGSVYVLPTPLMLRGVVATSVASAVTHSAAFYTTGYSRCDNRGSSAFAVLTVAGAVLVPAAAGALFARRHRAIALSVGVGVSAAAVTTFLYVMQTASCFDTGASVGRVLNALIFPLDALATAPAALAGRWVGLKR